MKTLSIITVNYNNYTGLKRTLDSIFSQTYNLFEYIIIDGESEDGSLGLIKEHRDKIDFWVSKRDKGVYHAMNKGIKRAKGEYLLFLNSGDYLDDCSVLENLFKQDFEQDIVRCNLKILDVENGTATIKHAPKKITGKYLISDYMPHPSTLIRKDLFNRVGYYNESNAIVSDWEFFLKAFLLNNATYHKVNEVLSVFITGGLSSKKENQLVIENEKKDILRNNFRYIDEDYVELLKYEKKSFQYFKSAEYKVIQFLKKTGLVSLGIFLLETGQRIKKFIVNILRNH